MTPVGTVAVTGPRDLRGTIDTAVWPLDGSRTEVLVQIEGGESVFVPFEALIRQEDGSYRLNLDLIELGHCYRPGSEPGAQPLVLPIIEETITVHPSPVETGRVRIRKQVHEHEEVVDVPLLRDEVVVERVPINRVVEGSISTRMEGETLIIPLLEEVMVVEKRLLLKEELRITKHQVETHRPQRVTLRREEAIVERVNPVSGESNPCT